MRYLQFIKESEYGYTHENSPALTVEGNCSLDVPDEPYIELPNMQETNTTALKGYYVPDGDIEIGLDLQTAHVLLYYCLGGYTYDSTNKTHILYTKGGTELPSFTVCVGKENKVGKDGFEHIFRGVVVDSFSLDISEDLAMLKMTCKAKIDFMADIKEFVDIPDYYPIAFYHLHAFLAGQDVSPDTNSYTLELNNNLAQDKGKGLGSMFPYYMPSDGKEINISTDIAFQGSKYLRMFWGATDEEDNGPTEDVTFFDYKLKGHDRAENEIEVICPKCYFKSISQNLDGKEAIVHNAGIEVLKGKVGLKNGSDINTSIVIYIKNDEERLDVDTLN